jgi:hypothetical protein
MNETLATIHATFHAQTGAPCGDDDCSFDPYGPPWTSDEEITCTHMTEGGSAAGFYQRRIFPLPEGGAFNLVCPFCNGVIREGVDPEVPRAAC